ncbi:hypothetical protein NMY22_g6570 [Coprinellus aureogranulatus]|nr:hypothetical protein NMY22_g6570 [Coprinellus aureogranulatus]
MADRAREFALLLEVPHSSLESIFAPPSTTFLSTKRVDIQLSMSESMEVDMAVVPNDPQPQQTDSGNMEDASEDLLSPLPTPVVRSQTSGKVIAEFDETSDLQAEKRGNFVVIGLVDGPRVVSWSLNALNNSETLRLLACIELACYRCKQAIADPRNHVKTRRRIERVIKDDRRRRHRRRKDQEAMIDAFAKQTLSNDVAPQDTPNSATGTPLQSQGQTV